MGKDFKIQIPQSIVRNKEVKLSDRGFVLLAKLIQAYYTQPSDYRELTFDVDHKQIMHFIDMSNKRKFSSCLKELYACGLITNEIAALPRKGGLTISLSESVIPEFNKGQFFVQLESHVLHRTIIEKVGHTGIRILYNIMSYINYKVKGKDHCYASVIAMANDLDITEKTFIKYIAILEEVKFIKVVRHSAVPSYSEDKNGNEGLLFERWNNHYHINHDKFKLYIEKKNSLLHT